MKTQTEIPLILSALRAFALSAVCAVALIALAPAAFAETKTERLLGEPLNEFAVDENGWTHLHWAAVADDEESVRRLLEMGAPVDFKNNGDGSDFSDEAALRQAVFWEAQHLSEWRRQGGLRISDRPRRGEFRDARKRILASPRFTEIRDANKRRKAGYTPIMLAYSHNIISLLIAGGANVNREIPVWTRATEGERSKIAPWGDTLLRRAVRRPFRTVETAELLLENGADVNAKGGEFDRTPLHVAVAPSNFWVNNKMVKLLLENGADVNAKDGKGNTPLNGLGIKTGVETAALLLENGADVNTKNEWGGTPLHDAAFHGVTELAALLLENGADVNAKDEEGDTPLHSVRGAVMDWTGNLTNQERDDEREGNGLEMAALLLENGADVNAKGKGGVTPLHRVVFSGLVAVADLLLENGADVNAKESNSLWNLFWEGGNVSDIIRAYFKERGIAPPRSPFLTPLDYAKSPKMRALLREHGALHYHELPRE